MGEFKGTKGNWIVKGGSLIADNTYNETGKTIAAVNVCDIEKDKWVANAKLIAAAPELLEMLIFVVNNNGLDHEGFKEAIDLIKKATE